MTMILEESLANSTVNEDTPIPEILNLWLSFEVSYQVCLKLIEEETGNSAESKIFKKSIRRIQEKIDQIKEKFISDKLYFEKRVNVVSSFFLKFDYNFALIGI